MAFGGYRYTMQMLQTLDLISRTRHPADGYVHGVELEQPLLAQKGTSTKK
ncbi:MAG: hypothetical protein RJQ14_02820 [Marinoscillum sp.]